MNKESLIHLVGQCHQGLLESVSVVECNGIVVVMVWC